MRTARLCAGRRHRPLRARYARRTVQSCDYRCTGGAEGACFLGRGGAGALATTSAGAGSLPGPQALWDMQWAWGLYRGCEGAAARATVSALAQGNLRSLLPGAVQGHAGESSGGQTTAVNRLIGL